ncbi:MAG: hypothetical protein JSR60_08320 [Proteobacteria bacterium]|nr:hypothetical protein [Pseudomonadota bacterium]
MRVLWTAAVALIALTVSSCDINTTPKTAKVECNCAAPAVPGPSAYTPPPAAPHRSHHRGYAHATGHGHYWRREYSEISVFTYDYHSDSSGYAAGGSGHANGNTGYATGGGAAAGVWVDGYGRRHGTGGTVPPADDRARMAPWHGYDATCPDPDKPH